MQRIGKLKNGWIWESEKSVKIKSLDCSETKLWYFGTMIRKSVAHCKKSWRKTSPAWPDDAVLKYQGDGTLFRHADQVNPTSSYEEDGIFQRHWHSGKFSDNFLSTLTIFRQLSDHSPSTFRPFSVNFPTKESKSNWHQRGANPYPSWLHSSTLPLHHTNFLYKYVWLWEFP